MLPAGVRSKPSAPIPTIEPERYSFKREYLARLRVELRA